MCYFSGLFLLSYVKCSCLPYHLFTVQFKKKNFQLFVYLNTINWIWLFRLYFWLSFESTVDTQNVLDLIQVQEYCGSREFHRRSKLNPLTKLSMFIRRSFNGWSPLYMNSFSPCRLHPDGIPFSFLIFYYTIKLLRRQQGRDKRMKFRSYVFKFESGCSFYLLSKNLLLLLLWSLFVDQLP